MAWVSLCALDELIEGKGKFVEIDGYQLAVFLHEGKAYVVDNYCPHAGGNLAGGFVEDGCAVCPWHYWAFKLDTGELRDTSAVAVETYRTRLYERAGQSPLVQADLKVP
jgi:nitrite reductase (NADH) small subunit